MAASVQAIAGVRARRQVESRVLALWHLLSLDAPSVAAAWTWFAARASGVPLPWQGVASMFCAVWVLYAADRLLDARGTVGLEERHLFHRCHSRGFRWGIAVGCMALAALMPHMAVAEVRLDVALAVLLAAWFAAIHWVNRIERPLPKEFAVGVFFAAAVFAPIAARRPESLRELLLPAALFGAACCLNCLFIFAWEQEALHEANAHRLTLAAARWAPWLGVGLAAACVAQRGNAIAEAVGISAALLVVLHRLRGRVERTTLRALADLALLTPLVLGCWR